MIPKKIHYCWFGSNEKSKKIQKCINSWKKICPDYEIIEWNESNFDINQHPYLKYCYDNKKYAFLSDFARLLIVYEHGGIYFDTDVELVKKIDFLLKYNAFYGFETDSYINSGQGFGAEIKSKSLKFLINSYEKLETNNNNDYPLIGCPKLNTSALAEYGFEMTGKKQIIDNVIVLPVDYMNPYDDPTGKLNITDNTISIHWYSKSWLSKKAIIRSTLTKPIHRIFGVDCFRWLKK